MFSRGNPQPQDLRAHLDQRFRRPLMAFFLRRVRDRTLAEDLTQDVFVRLLKTADREPVENTEALVFTIASNLAKTHGARSRRAALPFSALDTEAITEISRHLVEVRDPERVLLGKEDARAILTALDELGARTRDIYLLSRMERLKHKEIAELYSISVSMVEKEVMKATAHLALCLGSDGA